VAEFMHESIVARVRRRRKESSRSLSHLLMSFLLFMQSFMQNVYRLVQYQQKSQGVAYSFIHTLYCEKEVRPTG